MMLEKGELIWFSRDKLDIGLKNRQVSDDARLSIEKIAAAGFDREADGMVIFLNKDNGNLKLSCYAPIYTKMSIFEKGKYVYKEEIDGCIFLDVFAIENIRTATERELFTIKDSALRSGYWREEYGIVAVR